MLLGLAPHVPELDGPFLQLPNYRLDVLDLLLLVVRSRRHTAHTLVEDFVDLVDRLNGILLRELFVGGFRVVIVNCLEVAATTESTLLLVVDKRVEGSRQVLDLCLDLVHSFDDFLQI